MILIYVCYVFFLFTAKETKKNGVFDPKKIKILPESLPFFPAARVGDGKQINGWRKIAGRRAAQKVALF